MFAGLALREGAEEEQEFLDKLSNKFPDYDAEDLETLAWSVDKDHGVPLIDAHKLPYNGKWKVCVLVMAGIAKNIFLFWKLVLWFQFFDTLFPKV